MALSFQLMALSFQLMAISFQLMAKIDLTQTICYSFKTRSKSIACIYILPLHRLYKSADLHTNASTNNKNKLRSPHRKKLEDDCN